MEYRRCSNYIFILDLPPGFNGQRQLQDEARNIEIWELFGLVLEVLL